MSLKGLFDAVIESTKFKARQVPRVPKQSWWGAVYCSSDIGCGNSGFVGASESEDEAQVEITVIPESPPPHTGDSDVSLCGLVDSKRRTGHVFR